VRSSCEGDVGEDDEDGSAPFAAVLELAPTRLRESVEVDEDMAEHAGRGKRRCKVRRRGREEGHARMGAQLGELALCFISRHYSDNTGKNTV
jgi:hypothetical protein